MRNKWASCWCGFERFLGRLLGRLFGRLFGGLFDTLFGINGARNRPLEGGRGAERGGDVLMF